MEIALKETFIDTFEVTDREWVVEDYVSEGSSNKVDGVNVLARVQGPFFLVNGTSLNNRFYSKNLWERAIKNSLPKLEGKRMMGTIGHDQKIDDKALSEGKISHIVTNLWITEDNVGMGEILILGTDSGRQLNALLRAGVPMPVSSRAFGKITKRNEGKDIVDPESFHLETFDFVLNPGVKSAYTTVVEHNSQTEPQEDQKMDENLKKLLEDQIGLQEELKTALLENNDLQKKLAEAEKSLAEAKEELDELGEGVRKWLELPGLKDAAEKTGLTKQNNMTTAKILKSLRNVLESVIEEKEAEKASVEKQYEALGSVDELTKVCDLLDTYTAMGSPEKIQEDLAAVNKLAKKINKVVVASKQKVAARKIAEAFKADKIVVLEMVKAMGGEATVKSLKALSKNKSVSERYTANESKPRTVKKEKSLLEKVSGSGGGYASRFFESIPAPVTTSSEPGR